MTLPALAAALVLAGRLTHASAGVPGITYVEQPEGIPLPELAAVWPALRPYVARLAAGDRAGVLSDLRRAAAVRSPATGDLNLLAQLEREDGRLAEAQEAIERAIAADPHQHLHHFQLAMVCFARLSVATGSLGRWKWHRKTRDAYQAAFELDPRPVPYRYYLAYSYLQTPALFGGDPDEALRLAEEGIAIGLEEFYVVRADVHRLRGEIAQAFADYDRSIGLRLFKLRAFLGAGRLALEKGDVERATRYFEWGARCRPERAEPHEGLGDCHAAAHDLRAASREYEQALGIDSRNSALRDKLSKLKEIAR